MNANSDTATFTNRRIRLILLATIVYVGILSLIFVPIINKMRLENTVKANLVQLIKKDNTTNHALNAQEAISGKPVAISIPRLDINLPIAPGYYNPTTKTWTLNSTDVFTDNNIDPNPTISTDQTRTTFLYGHDIPGVLIKTSQLVFGDTMTLTTDNGYQFHYYYDHSGVVPPTDTSILNEANTGDPVELMTCTGVWYQSRHVMYFHLLSVNKVGSNQSFNAGSSL